MARSLPPFFLAAAIVLSCCGFAAESGGEQALPTLDELYAPYTRLRGDLHLHSSTASFDSRTCAAPCETFSAAEQLAAARQAGLDFAVLTEHDRNPNDPNMRMTEVEWNAVLREVASANSADFVVLGGYEWTSSQQSCFEADPQQPDFHHKVVILPPGEDERCDSDVCSTPGQLAEWVDRAGGIIFTPHPWRVRLLEPRPGMPSFVTRDYFEYEGDGAGGVFVGAEVGPDFPPLRWRVLCGSGEEVLSQTGTLSEWKRALADGKRLAAMATSDRHFGFTPFLSRTTVLFADGKSPEGILVALKARRSMAANLEPFDILFAVGNTILGGMAMSPATVRLRVSASPTEIESIELWQNGERLQSFPPGKANQVLRFELPENDEGAIWVKVTGVDHDPATGAPRMTITSPIWVRQSH